MCIKVPSPVDSLLLLLLYIQSTLLFYTLDSFMLFVTEAKNQMQGMHALTYFVKVNSKEAKVI